ncbi:MAG: monofunctional biosynthetic peptidoglycan transglycosylase [Xanthobacteraceae bacterium]
MSSPKQRSKRRYGRLLRLLRWIAVVVVVLLLLPYLLVPIYRFVDPVSTVMMWRWLTGARVVRSVTPIGQMAESLPRTVIVAEDGRFCFHRGVDWGGLREAFQEADDLSEMRGGSTIAQQTAKNLFLWSGRSYLRKALELPLAIWIDLVLPKRRVMEIYLNIAEWGPNGVFGAQAAARHAFNKPVSRISAREAALLAAILPNPIRRSARQPGAGVRRLAGIYEVRAVRARGLASCVRRSP